MSSFLFSCDYFHIPFYLLHSQAFFLRVVSLEEKVGHVYKTRMAFATCFFCLCLCVCTYFKCLPNGFIAFSANNFLYRESEGKRKVGKWKIFRGFHKSLCAPYNYCNCHFPHFSFSLHRATTSKSIIFSFIHSPNTRSSGTTTNNNIAEIRNSFRNSPVYYLAIRQLLI